jgi:hypothetical protein
MDRAENGGSARAECAAHIRGFDDTGARLTSAD